MRTKLDADAAAYAAETQMFQRIAGTPETATEVLVEEFKAMRPATRRASLESAKTHNIIAQAAKRAGAR